MKVATFANLLLFLWFPVLLFGQTVQLKGVVKEAGGENLPHATIFILPDSIFIPSDLEGYFSVKLKAGYKSIRVSYTGYESYFSNLLLSKDTSVAFFLNPVIGQLREVAVTANPYSLENLLRSGRTGTTTLSRKDISAIPVMGGEADIIKTVQLLPGTVRGMEGSSDFFVRGGAADQNLVLLDGAPIYNTSHLFGFISVFNPDVLEKTEAITGGFPAEYGGRLSSILDITSRNKVAPKTHVAGNIGLIASRLFVEQPLLKDKLSIWVAGRRTYVDQVIKLTGQELPYYFYDLNGKVIFQPTNYDQFSFSYFRGEDNLNLSQAEDEDNYGFTSTYTAASKSQVARWRHWNPGGWNTDLSLFHTSFDYSIINIFQEDQLKAFSNIEDYGLKFSFQKKTAGEEGRLQSGFEWIRHGVSPNVVSSTGLFTDFLDNSVAEGIVAHEVAAYLQHDWQLSDRWLFGTGVRVSAGLVQEKEYVIPEPRFFARYALQENQALKLSYSRMAQYMHRISNSAISTPTDIWYTVTDSIQPQKAHQVSMAWQNFLTEPKIFLSAEAYYKSMTDLIGFEEGTNLVLNPDFESKLIQGKGRAYGLELLLRKEAGSLTGWLSYTLAWSWRQYNEINSGNWFPSRYDRRHNGALVMQYKLSNRWSASMVWEYISGSRFTPVIGQYVVISPVLSGVDIIPLYSGINEVKLSDTHRLDLGIRYQNNPDNRFRWNLFAGVNNLYNRASPIGIFIEQDEIDGSLRYIQPGLFGLLPFINFGFHF